MMEFKETYHPTGEITSRLVCDELPAAYDGRRYSWVITVKPNGVCHSRSRAEGNGSVRYYYDFSYDDAMAHAVSWAERKIAGAKKAAQYIINEE